MHLADFFSPDAISVDLRGGTKDEILAELVGLLRLDERASDTLLRMLQRRETLGSTGVGRGIAIPHCRSLVVSRLRLAYGHRRDGVEFQAIDDRPVHDFFLIVAPPLEVSNQYLPVLGKIAQFAKEPDIPDRLAAAPVGRGVLPAAGREGSVGRALRGSPPCCSCWPSCASRRPGSHRTARPRPLPRLARRRHRHRRAPSAPALARPPGPQPSRGRVSVRRSSALRRGASSARIPERSDARDGLRRLTRRRPDWPYAWHALALAEIRRAAEWERADALALGNRVGTGTLERAIGTRAPGARRRTRDSCRPPSRLADLALGLRDTALYAARARRAPPGRAARPRPPAGACCLPAAGWSGPPTRGRPPSPRSPRRGRRAERRGRSPAGLRRWPSGARAHRAGFG